MIDRTRPSTRYDLLRREGARGEIATVEERVERMSWLLSHRQRVLPWRSLLWDLEQLHRQIDRLEGRGRTDSTRAMRDVLEHLERGLADLDAVLTELRAEADGTGRHLKAAISTLTIDLTLADQYRLYAAGLDAALNEERPLEQSA